MLPILIRRELLNNLMTFRFSAALFITLLLVVANTAVLIQDYEHRLGSYHASVKRHQNQLREAKAYSDYMLFVDRAPNPLSIFNVGLDKRVGNLIGVYHGFVPSLWDAEMHGTDNPFLAFFSSIDIVFIFEVVLSLLGLIFAYDAIAGERERGTLRLVLAQPVRRGHILLAKWFSAMTCLLVPLLISLLLATLLLTTSASISVKANDFVRIGGIVLAAFAYLSLFYLLGLFISTVTRRANTALMLAMFVWGFLVLVYPNLIRAAHAPFVTPARVQARVQSAKNQIQQIWDELKREREQFLKREGVDPDAPNFEGVWELWFHADVDAMLLAYYDTEHTTVLSDVPPAFEKHIPLVKRYYVFMEPLTIRAAERTWRIRKPVLDDVFVRQAVMDRLWLKLSPVGMFDSAAQAWAGTDLGGMQAFFAAVRRYRLQVIDYFYARDMFASQQWFFVEERKVDWRALPRFSFERSDVLMHAKRALPDMLLLFLVNVALFMGILLVFIRREV